jgi:hypothetical protein
MKIKEWIIFGVSIFLATASASLSAEKTHTFQDSISQLETSLQTVKEQSVAKDGSKVILWPELQEFQSLLWRSMALDPSLIAPVPLADVPKNLFSAELNAELQTKFAELKKSSRQHDLQVDAEFSQYITTVEKMLAFRRMRQFPQARAIGKRGFLDQVFSPLQKKIYNDTAANPPPAFAELENEIHALKEQGDENPTKDSVKKEVFTNGNRFIGYMIAAMVGLFLGLAGYRMHPDFFQKLLNHLHTNAPTPTTHSVGADRLDYARWLREFEELLSRLKSSQMTVERRIEDLVQNSDKISQHSLSLYADPRIKSEANLEYRMSALLREAQHQSDQSQRLRSGDRVQINLMLEHCLKLCDAIESNTIQYDRKKAVDGALTQRTA